MKKKTCLSLDMRMTGQMLKQMIKKKGYTVSEIQKELKLSCPQPVYRWINGQTMPSIDNLYKLSTLLDVHMEDLLLPRQDEVWMVQKGRNPCRISRLKTYHDRYLAKRR